MLLRIEPAGLARDHTQRWWNEVAIQARDALADGDTKLALQLVDHAEVPVGDQYVDQQFLVGFIALRFLQDAGARADLFPAPRQQCHPADQQIAGRILAGPRL